VMAKHGIDYGVIWLADKLVGPCSGAHRHILRY
jgi:hypothetical protein